MSVSPNPIKTDTSNTFAHESMTGRVPEIIRSVQADNDFSDFINQRLDALYLSVKNNDLIQPPELPAPDADMWTAAFESHPNARWLETDWFFCEPYFFRQIIEATNYWQWKIDPYQKIKNTELNANTLSRIEKTLQFSGDDSQVIGYLLEAALWGNRADLSHPSSKMSQLAINPDDLLADDRLAAVDRILNSKGAVHIVCDNFGTEVAMDLVLTDALLSHDIPVMLHLKMHPTYVSDATVKDIHDMLKWLKQNSESEIIGRFHNRLMENLNTGKLRLAPDFFWNSPYFLDAMPPRLVKTFDNSRLVILKGDMNYRRAVYDTVFPVDTPFSEVVSYMSAPLLALRTLKSDPVVGVSVEKARQAEQADSQWRVNGQRGVIQFAL